MRNIHQLIDRQVNCWSNITQKLHYAPGGAAVLAEPAPGLMGRLHPVLCLSRDLGCGARLISRELCQRLHYEVFGTALIDAIAQDMNLQRHLIDGLDERSRNELEIMVHSYLEGHEVASEEYLRSLVRVVQTMATGGGVVLLGRGAAYILGNRSALNVLITASLESRIRRMAAYESVDEEQARRRVMEADENRTRFIRKMFKRDAHDATAFDLAINTDRIEPEAAVALILRTLEARGFDLDQMALPRGAD